jgi:putative pre-16S rRNA nuclease
MASQRTNFSAGSSSASRRGRILAIDYGRRRIGLAISDELGLLAQPLETLERRNRQNDLRRLGELVRKRGVQRILVGLPLRLDGGAGEMAEEAARFALRLGTQLKLPVELVDERLTSWEAEQMLAGSRRRRRRVDEIAAAIFLDQYLAREREKA